MAKTREFIAKVEGVQKFRLVWLFPKQTNYFEFILDSSCRERILKAYLNMGGELSIRRRTRSVKEEDVTIGEVQHVDIAVAKIMSDILKTL